MISLYKGSASNQRRLDRDREKFTTQESEMFPGKYLA